jgi:chemotaxis family two-component system response regulator Rcp1
VSSFRAYASDGDGPIAASTDFNSSARANHLPKVVLLVEDNPGDARLAREAFNATPGAVAERIHLYEASDGAAAMAYLRREGAPRPDIILIDINLPRMSGLELLAEIKEDADLKVIPVIVLSSSDAPRDLQKSYRLGANCYFKKPSEWDEFVSIAKAIKDFWLIQARLPASG